MKKLLLFFLLISLSYSQTWNLVSGRLLPANKFYIVDLRKGGLGTGFVVGYFNPTSPDSGSLRFNLGSLQYYDGSAWVTLSYSGGTTGFTKPQIDTVGTVVSGVWNATPVTAPYGGTGQSTFTQGDILSYSSGTTLSKVPIGTSNQFLGVSSAAAAVEYKTLATGTTGVDFNISHSGSTTTFNLPTASASARGAYSTTDYARTAFKDENNIFTLRNTFPSVAIDTAVGKTSTKIIFPDTAFFGVQSTLNNELVNIISNIDADFHLWTASTSDPSSVNMFRSRGTIASPSNITAGDVVGQVRGFGYKDGFKELANISFPSQTDTTAAIAFHTRSSSGLAERWDISSTGRLQPTLNNTYSFGSSALRPDTIWGQSGNFFTDLVVGTSDPGAIPSLGEKLRVRGGILGTHTINTIGVGAIHPVFHVVNADSDGTTLESGDVIGSFAGIGWDGTSYSSTEPVGISFTVAGTFTATSHPSRMSFWTTKTDSINPITWFQIEPTGEFISSRGDNTGNLGTTTTRFAKFYGMDGFFGDTVSGVTGTFTGAVSGTTGTFTSTLSGGATGSALTHSVSSSSAAVFRVTRGASSLSAAVGRVVHSGFNASSAVTDYAFTNGYIMATTAGIESGGWRVQTRRFGVMADRFGVDSAGNLQVYSGGVASTLVDSLRNITAGKMSSIAGITTTGISGVAPIVDTVNYSGIGSSISARNLPATAGRYRLTYSLFTTTAGSGGTVLATVSYDNGAAQTQVTATVQLNSTAIGSSGVTEDQFIYTVVSGTPTIATTVTGAAGSPVYTFKGTVERIQ